MNATLEAEYRALTEGAGIADVSDRTLVEVSGADRAKFLHNLCTSDILRLAPGQGCEAFLLNVKGRVAGHVFVYCSEESLILDSSPRQGEKIISHLDRYIIREKVELGEEDLFSQYLISGAKASELLHRLSCPAPQEMLNQRAGEIASAPVFVRRSGLIGPNSFTLLCLAVQKDDVAKAVTEVGAAWCGAAAVEAARIEAGVPLYGLDITEDNLPQEVDRNDRAINFTKGCYLGQETVARIDALGHVNRTLVGLRFSSRGESPQGELKAGDAAVGRVTSSAYSPHYGADIGLGYVRQGHNQPGSRLACDEREAEVVPLPMR